MITLCIDESGNFEDKRHLKKFVGGFIYIGEDYREEEERIERFLKNQCKEKGLRYPEDIHSTKMNEKDRTKKDEISKEILKYIRGNGNYHFVCLLKSNEKRDDYNNISNIINDENVSNLYEHMVCNLIFNIIFYNKGFYDDKKVNLEVATRSIPIGINNKNEIDKYKTLGYDCRLSDDKSKYIFYLTDIKTFKSAIGVKMMENKIDKPIDFTMDVRSINYVKNDKPTTPFLYIADFVCDTIKDNLDLNKNDFDIENASKKITKTTGLDFLFWVYDDIDSILNNLVKNINNKDLIACLNEGYNLKESKSHFKRYYWSYWYKHFKQDVKKTFDINMMNIYVSRIEYMFLKDIHEYNKGLYIALELWDIFEDYNKCIEIKNERIFKKYFYRLSDLILRGYNHIGDAENAKKYFNVCNKYKKAVNIEEYMATINRIVEIGANEFSFDSAIEKLSMNLLGLDEWKKTKKDVAELMGLNEQMASCLVLRGKVLSSKGQFYSFKGEKNKAEECFEEALKEFIDDKRNKQVTLSYYMHLAIANRDLTLYKKYEKDYFGTDDISEQFKSVVLLSNKQRPDEFKLFVYIKALDVFYGETLENKFLDKIKSVDFKKIGFEVNSNPWQLIYKHIALLLYKNGLINEGNNMIERAVSCVENSGITVKLINLCTKLESNKFNKDQRNQKKILSEFEREINKYSEINKYFKECFNEGKDEEIVDKVINKFTYMYR